MYVAWHHASVIVYLPAIPVLCLKAPAFTDVAKKNPSTKCGRLKTNMNVKSLGLRPLSYMYIDPWNTVCVP